MLRALFSTLTIFVLAVGSAKAGNPPAPAIESNAALKYWQGFATLPKFTEAEEVKLRAEALTMPLDAQAREIVNKAEYSLRMMHRAALMPHCSWGLTYEDGINALLPHAQPSRVMSSLACLRARLRFSEGRKAEAIDDLIDGMTLGRHISLDGTMIAVLVGYNIEHRMIETLAIQLPRLDASTIKALKKRVDALPPFGTVAQALITCEKATLDWFAREVVAIKNEERLTAFLTTMTGSPEKSRTLVAECGGNAEGLVKCADRSRESYVVIAAKMDLPPDQFEKQLEVEMRKQLGNPVFDLLFPAINKVFRAKERSDVYRALFSAALAVQLEGRDALKTHLDPVGGGSFEQVPFLGGYELRSKLKRDDGRPVTLTVGHSGC